MLPKTLEWISEKRLLRILDQRCLPYKIIYKDCATVEDVALSIEDMVVRGAPAIGCVAAYGMVLASYTKNISVIIKSAKILLKSRPTAVNLNWSINRMLKVLDENIGQNNLSDILEREAIEIEKEDLLINKTLSNFGQQLLPASCSIITHCNTGSFATAGYGTALGVIRAAKKKNKIVNVYVNETRPRLQGGLITSYELFEEGFNVTVICDSSAAYLMSKVQIDAVIVGADRIASNGDVANKIGTYNLAIVAKKHNIPFYVAAPFSTFDMTSLNGKDIPIEERSGSEIRQVGNCPVIPERIPVWNPAFDVTPSNLISAIITERGVLLPPYNEKIKTSFGKNTEIKGAH